MQPAQNDAPQNNEDGRHHLNKHPASNGAKNGKKGHTGNGQPPANQVDQRRPGLMLVGQHHAHPNASQQQQPGISPGGPIFGHHVEQEDQPKGQQQRAGYIEDGRSGPFGARRINHHKEDATQHEKDQRQGDVQCAVQ